MKLKRKTLLFICAGLAVLSTGSATLDKLAIKAQHLDSLLKPPPPQQVRLPPHLQRQIPIPPGTQPTPLPFMQRIARWFLSAEDTDANHLQSPIIPQAQGKQSYGITKAIIPQKAAESNVQLQPCRPCNSIPWVPMFPIKGDIKNAFMSFVSGHNFGGGGANHGIRPQELPLKTYPSGPTGSEHLPVPASAPQHITTRRPPNLLTGFIPRPAPRPPPPPPPPPPYRVPPRPLYGMGDQRQLMSFLTPPYNRPSIYSQMRPHSLAPQKDPITITIHENKNKPNAIYSIPGGPQIQFMSDFRPSGYGGAAGDFKSPPPNVPQLANAPEIVPSIPLVHFLSSVEYPMQLGNTYMMDLTKEKYNVPNPTGGVVNAGYPALLGPIGGLPIQYSSPEKKPAFIGPLPSTPSPDNASSAGYHTTRKPFTSPRPPAIHSTTFSPQFSISSHSELPTVSSVFSTTLRSNPPIRVSTESPKFANSYNPTTSTLVDIQPSIQTAGHLSSQSNKDTANQGIKIHPGQGFTLTKTEGNFRGHFITEHPSSNSGITNAHANGNKYNQRPSPSPFQPPTQINGQTPSSLAPGPALWSQNHPYSYEVPPIMNNYDAISTGTGKTQVPISHNQAHTSIEAPPEYTFVHENKGSSSGRLTPKPFSSSSTPLPLGPNTGEQLISTTTKGTDADDFQKRGKKTKQIQIIIPYITGSEHSKDVDTALPSNQEHTILLPINSPSGENNDSYNEPNKLRSGQTIDNALFKWHDRNPGEDDYHVHQESRTVSASAPHPNHLGKATGTEMKVEIHKETGKQHVLANNLRDLLSGEVDQMASDNPLLNLQRNIDAWTAQQYSGKPTTATTVGTVNSKATTKSFFNLFDDHEASGSHDHSATARLDYRIPTTTPIPRSTERYKSSTFWGVQSNFVIPEATKATNSSQNREKNEEPKTSTTTVANWSQAKVAISPITKEKVYVVTPMSSGTWEEPTTAMPRQTTTTTPRPVRYQPTTPSTPSSSPRDVTIITHGPVFQGKSPRFLVRPTPGGRTDGRGISSSVFVSSSTDASVRENAEDIASNDIFFATERPRHKASEGTFGVYGPSGPPGVAVTPSEPSFTLLEGTQIKTYTGHSRVVTSVSSPTFSYTSAYSASTPRAQSRIDELTDGSSKSGGKREEDDGRPPTDSDAQSQPQDSLAQASERTDEDYISHIPDLHSRVARMDEVEGGSARISAFERER